MKKTKIIDNKKVWTEIKNDKESGIGTVITGDCEICHCFPCKHIDMNTWTPINTMKTRLNNI